MYSHSFEVILVAAETLGYLKSIIDFINWQYILSSQYTVTLIIINIKSLIFTKKLWSESEFSF